MKLAICIVHQKPMIPSIPLEQIIRTKDQEIYQLQEENRELRKINRSQYEQVQLLEREVQAKEERISELQCLSDPYSSDGDAICNSHWT